MVAWFRAAGSLSRAAATSSKSPAAAASNRPLCRTDAQLSPCPMGGHCWRRRRRATEQPERHLRRARRVVASGESDGKKAYIKKHRIYIYNIKARMQLSILSLFTSLFFFKIWSLFTFLFLKLNIVSVNYYAFNYKYLDVASCCVNMTYFFRLDLKSHR